MPELPLNSWDLRAFSVDVRATNVVVVSFTLICCLMTAMLAGLIPAWRCSRNDLQALLKRASGDIHHHRIQSILCASQIAICVVLLTSAGLMERTLSNLDSTALGFDRDHVASVSIDPRSANYSDEKNWILQQRLIQDARAIPGIENAAFATMPLMRGIGVITTIGLPGQRAQLTNMNFVTPDYFDVLKMRVVAGRQFEPADDPNAKPIPTVVNEEFVRRFFGTGSAIGARIGRNGDRQIIGVVNDSYYRSLRETPPPIMYSLYFGPKTPANPFVLYVRTRSSPSAIIEPIRKLMHSIDPAVPVYDATTLLGEINRSLWRERVVVMLARSFAICALLLSAIGLYGVLANFVTQRRKEIGLRLALGATAAHMTETVAKHIAVVVGAGFVCGLTMYLIAGRWLRSLLFGVNFTDPVVISASVVLVVLMAGAAAGLPIYRALHIDPASTLKSE